MNATREKGLLRVPNVDRANNTGSEIIKKKRIFVAKGIIQNPEESRGKGL